MIEGKPINKVILISILHLNKSKWIKDLQMKMKPLVYKEKYKWIQGGGPIGHDRHRSINLTTVKLKFAWVWANSGR